MYKYYGVVSEKTEGYHALSATATREAFSLEMKGENWRILSRETDAWPEIWRLNLKDSKGIPRQWDCKSKSTKLWNSFW